MKTKTVILGVSVIISVVALLSFKLSKKSDYVLIPAGSTIIDGRTYSFDAYWISDHEVTNNEYKIFLTDLKSSGRIEEYEICNFKTSKPSMVLKNGSSNLNEAYYAEKAFAEYPVLYISHQAAQLYCSWLSEKCAKQNQQYRLPTKQEWIYAAKGGLENANYAWGGNYLRNRKGQFMCNYKHIGDEYIYSDTNHAPSIIEDYIETGNIQIATSLSKSYSPNEYGLYNVCGNVAEMINEEGVAMGGSCNSTGYDVRITSELNYNSASSYVGFRPVRVQTNITK